MVEAREFPEVYLGSHAAGPEAVEFAERAAVADLALRMQVAEATIRAQDRQATILQARTPRVWVAFREGDIATANVRTIADLVQTLPEQAWTSFEDAVFDRASTLAPARFATFARAARERAQPDPVQRHQVAAQGRRVRLDRDIDGMCWLTAYLPAQAGERAMARIDAGARALADAADESRTLEQLRADVTADLLAGVLRAPGGAGVAVAVTVPVLTLLGVTDEPGTLEGYGPIDPETARELAGHAPSFTRILTHPVTGAVLDVDRDSYRVPADLKRWLRVRDGNTCTFPGCGRAARDCDLDHTIAWEHGGTTTATNLAHLCRDHHRLKHNTAWTVHRTPEGATWRSPTGTSYGTDPPPF